MLPCPHCGLSHPAEVRFCPSTGRALGPQNSVCRHCGTTMPIGVRFCPKCGTRSDDTYQSGINVDLRQALRQPRILLVLVIVVIFVVGLLAIVVSGINSPPTSEQFYGGSIEVPVGDDELQRLTPTSLIASLPVSTASATPTPESLATPIVSKNNPKDGSEIIFIPPGKFIMGSNKSDDPFFWGAESPEHIVELTAYWIYRTEVTQGMYQACVSEESCAPPESINNAVGKQYGDSFFINYPVVMVSWKDAFAYCQWAGARLPTEAEWEKAARGIDGRLFPWGSGTDVDARANYSSSSTVAVGSYPTGASPYGIYDMAGNVLEWVNDYFESSYYQRSPIDNPLGPDSGSRRSIRGGAFTQDDISGLRTVARASLKPNDAKISVGFRCVMDTP